MDCDYYIEKLLRIHYINKEEEEEEYGEVEIVNYGEIELEIEKRYFNWKIYDEDEEDYEKKMKAYIEDRLTPIMKPILIYINGSFTTPIFETKYKDLIQKELDLERNEWSDVKKIVKGEVRYLRQPIKINNTTLTHSKLLPLLSKTAISLW
jgi:hypothetical protein